MVFEGYVFEYLSPWWQRATHKRPSGGERALGDLRKVPGRPRNTEPVQVSPALMNEYLFTLKSGAFNPRGRALSDGTYRDHLIALNDFFRWLIVREKLLVNPMADAAQPEGSLPSAWSRPSPRRR